MQESAFVERAIIQPEKKPANIFKIPNVLANRANKIGELFIRNRYCLDGWSAQSKTETNLEMTLTKTKLRIIKNKKNTEEEMHLTYERPMLSRIEQRKLSEIVLRINKETSLGLRKNKNNDWEFFKSERGEIISELTPQERLKLQTHLILAMTGIEGERIINILDSTKVLRVLALPALALYAYGHNIGSIQTRIENYLHKDLSAEQEKHTVTVPKEKKPSYPINRLSPGNEKMFQDEALSVRKNFYQQENNMLVMSTLGLIDDLSMTTRFFSQPQLKNGRDFSNTVGKYLMYSQDSNSRYRWRTYVDGQPEKRLVKPLWQMLKTIREDKNPQSQKNYFRVLDAFMHYKGQSVVTPEKIMIQFGMEGNLDFINGKDLWQNYWSIGPDNFNKGPIKGFWASPNSVIPGEILVTDFGQVGIIMNVTKDNKVVVMVVDAKGQSRRVVYDESNFPQAIVFGNTDK